MEDCFESFPEDVSDWSVIREITDLDLDDALSEHSEAIPSVQLLPREDVSLYGIIPKMEQTIYTKCRDCRMVFHPRNVLSHKSCSRINVVSPAIPHISNKKVKNKGITVKKPKDQQSPSSTAAPVSSSLANSTLASVSVRIELTGENASPAKIPKTASSTTVPSQPPSVVSHSNSVAEPVPLSPPSTSNTNSTSGHPPKSHQPPWPSGTTSAPSGNHHHKHHYHHPSHHDHHHGRSGSSSSSSNRNKKSRKTTGTATAGAVRVAAKEFDPDVHCGVVESGKGPCTRSITCSSHRIQLRKLVPGRSKDILQLIAEKKTSKEQKKEKVDPSPNGLLEEKDFFPQGTTYVSDVRASEPAKTKAALLPAILPKGNNDIASYSRQTTSLSSDKPMNGTMDVENSKSLKVKDIKLLMHVKQEEKNGPVPNGYMPISPISVCSPVPDWKMMKEYYVKIATSTSVLVPIGNHSTVKMYRSHPKPVAIPTYSTKKVGGAILISNPHVDNQRQEILMAINQHKMLD